MWGQGFGPAAELPLGAELYVRAGSVGDLVAVDVDWPFTGDPEAGSQLTAAAVGSADSSTLCLRPNRK